MDNVINTDAFKQAETLNTFRRLVGLLDKHNEEILKDPLRYFREAKEVIARKEKKLMDLEMAAFPRPDFSPISRYRMPQPIETMVVTKEDYECLMAVRAIFKSER